MLFNSYPFLLAYLPFVVFGAWALRRRFGPSILIPWLGVASLAFYGISSPRHLPLLLGSILCNYGIGQRIVNAAPGDRRERWLWLGVTANLALLATFKYSSFAARSVNLAIGASLPEPALELPVGISFFTFTQIAFLVDACRREVGDYRWGGYLLFVSYFPHLVAGPILHHQNVIPQFQRQRFGAFMSKDVASALTLFAMGLAKKVLLADELAPFADAGFAAADQGTLLTFWEAWFVLLAYAFQLYFDFSGYSDMAVALSLLFGVDIPINFRSPYRAESIIEFWRRWHISLSAFLRDYVYIPLGGGREGIARRYRNLMITMLVGGLWHGAGWGFVAWGGLHGLYLLVNHAWRRLWPERKIGIWIPGRLARLTSWWLTFAAVTLAWSFFRSSTFAGALNLIGGAIGIHGVGLPQSLGPAAHWLQGVIPWVDWQANGMFPHDLTEHKLAWMSCVAIAGAIAWLMPNSNAFAALPNETDRGRTLQRATVVLAGSLFAFGLLSLQRNSPFLYFQF
jgi:D-alanyl-lipoteichoic acid acyltransferase DltB (MBOAT superfamily)